MNDHHWTRGLSVRTRNALHNHGLNSKEEAIAAIKTGSLSHKPGKTRNYGWKSHVELCRLLGLEPLEKRRCVLIRHSICPKCGHPLT